MTLHQGAIGVHVVQPHAFEEDVVLQPGHHRVDRIAGE